MSAEQRNQYWKNREIDGRPKIFDNPDQVWDKAQEYFEWCDKHPWTKSEAIKGGQSAGTSFKIDIGRPYTIEGFCLHLGITYNSFLNYEKKSKSHKDFFQVFTLIRAIIEQNQLEGATVGAYNASIIARKLGLVDKKDIGNSDGSLKPVYNVMVPDQETADLLKKLDE